MIRTLIHALSVCAICLTSSCATDWDWKADPYMGDHATQTLVNPDTLNVKCDSPEFDNFVCFTTENIAELEYNIQKVKRFCMRPK